MTIKGPKPKPFNPDVSIIIDHNSTTGQTVIKSGNGKPLNSLLVAQLALGVGKANLDNYIAQAAGLLTKQSTEPRSATNPPHNFVACFDNPEICNFCGSHKGNHTIPAGAAPDPRYCAAHGVMQCVECFQPAVKKGPMVQSGT